MVSRAISVVAVACSLMLVSGAAAQFTPHWDAEGLAPWDDPHISVEVRHPWSAETPYLYRLVLTLNDDYRQMGVGGNNSWGEQTLAPYRLLEPRYTYSFRLRPFRADRADPAELARQRMPDVAPDPHSRPDPGTPSSRRP